MGGGAVLYLLAGRGAQASDVYAPLMSLWRMVQSDPQTLIDDYARQWQALQADRPAYYYAVRARFNTRPNPCDLNFLLRTCVNGIVRFNAGGDFNMSYHLSRRGMQPHRFAGIVRRWHAVLRPVVLRTADFRDALAGAGPGDFAYLDPPYADSLHRYTQNLDRGRLLAELESLNRRGVKWALSFDDPARDRTIPSDLYRSAHVLPGGNSPLRKVLQGRNTQYRETLYLNYDA